ncbi:hypothetical protein FRC0421_01689 [Corynebacterium diphtheriae]|nr:hypothetical protein FRC0184_01562 [Corynebacterium diphtheriae]CAB0809657.1 hypothetical protein FRC0209_01734 [Corynebacterium diphtheriae]CAB0839857.1 hypothetical protein FRC0323_00897 [Corynebacterium diphtheriae]CAB0912097.1 hypothetical protein FRC0421_01689 [Corynebacterium diphtheriae]
MCTTRTRRIYKDAAASLTNGIKTCEALTTTKNDATYLIYRRRKHKEGALVDSTYVKSCTNAPFFETLTKQSTQA